MSLQRSDAAGETSLSGGSGDLALSGTAIQGFVTFAKARQADGTPLSDGASLRVRIFNVDEATPANTDLEFEVTQVTWNKATNTIQNRLATPYQSSNSGALVGFTRTPLAVAIVQTAADFEVFSNIDGGTPTSTYGGTTVIDAGGP